MHKFSEIPQFQDKQNIVLQGFDPVSAGGFTQVPNFLLKDPKVSANAKVVYSMLLSYAWNNDKVFPGQERLAEEIGSTRSTVNRGIGELEQSGWLTIQRRGQGKTNLYVLKYRVLAKNPIFGNLDSQICTSRIPQLRIRARLF